MEYSLLSITAVACARVFLFFTLLYYRIDTTHNWNSDQHTRGNKIKTKKSHEPDDTHLIVAPRSLNYITYQWGREKEKLQLIFQRCTATHHVVVRDFCLSTAHGFGSPIARFDYRWWSRGVVARSWSVSERKRSRPPHTTHTRGVGPFSCPFSTPAILYRPLAPRTGRGLMEIYDSHLIGFNVPRISSSRNASSDFFRTVCSFRALTTSAIKTYARGVRERCGSPISMGPTCLVWRAERRALSPSHAAKADSVLKAHEKSGKCLPRHWVYYCSSEEEWRLSEA